MTEQSIIIVIADAESEKFQMSAEMLQDFSMSFILYLFYTAELLKICNNFRERLNVNIFINDTILLIDYNNLIILRLLFKLLFNYIIQK